MASILASKTHDANLPPWRQADARLSLVWRSTSLVLGMARPYGIDPLRGQCVDVRLTRRVREDTHARGSLQEQSAFSNQAISSQFSAFSDIPLADC